MQPAPQVQPGDWITVQGHRCVVQRVFQAGAPSGLFQVVFDKAKPTTRRVDWDGEKWFFPPSPDFGGYGRDSDPYVRQLKRGE